MKHDIIHTITLGMAVLLVGSCRSHQQAATEKPRPGVETVPQVDKPMTQYIETDTLAVWDWYTANYTVETRGLSATGQVRMRRDSVIWLNATKLFELGRAKFTRDSVTGYLKVNNTYIRCSYADLRKHGIDISYATLQRVLTGKGSNRNIVQVEYDNFDTIGGEEFPCLLNLTINDKRFYTTATMKISRLLLNQPQEMPLTIPTSAERAL